MNLSKQKSDHILRAASKLKIKEEKQKLSVNWVKTVFCKVTHSLTYTTGPLNAESDWLTNILRCAIIFSEMHDERSSRQLS